MQTNFQNFLTLDGLQCPFDDCTTIVDDKAALIKHIGVDHLRVIGFIAPEKQIDIIKAYKKALNIEEVHCMIDMEKPQCSKDFGSRTGWLFHLSTVHYFKKLVSLFKTHSTEIKSSQQVIVINALIFFSKGPNQTFS